MEEDGGASRDVTEGVGQNDPGQRSRVDEFEHYRGLLFSIAYRMLGSVADAEDMVQETFLRWQQSSGDEIHSPRAFLVTITSRLCIKHLQLARVQREQYVGPWLPEPVVTGPIAINPPIRLEIDESLSMGFLVLLERLTPVERAVFLLREVFDYEYGEVARITSLNEANCRQILSRARQRVHEGRPRFDAAPQQTEELLKRFIDAAHSGDMEGLLALLADDIVAYTDGGGKVAALPEPIYGAENFARQFLAAFKKFAPPNIVSRLTQINGQPGVIGYSNGKVRNVLTVNIVNGKIQNLYIVRNPDKLGRLPSLTSFVC